MQMDENLIEVLDVADIPDNNQSEKDEPEIKVNVFEYKSISCSEPFEASIEDYQSWRFIIMAVYAYVILAWYQWRQEDNLVLICLQESLTTIFIGC